MNATVTVTATAHPRSRGFTLMELMIAVVVFGILAAVAVPSYREHVAASRRTDAKVELLRAAQKMERAYTERGTYADVTLGPGESPYYTLSITTSPDADRFRLQATRTGLQVGDKCGDYTYDQDGTKGVPSASTGYTVAKCW